MLNNTLKILDFVTSDLNENVAQPAGYRFNLRHFDSGFGLRQTATSAIHAQQQGALGLIGEWTSTNSIAAALTTNAFGVPMCGGAATATDLSNKSIYPLYFRLIASDGLFIPGQGAFLAHLCKRWNWALVNVLVAEDAFGLSVLAAFRETAQALGNIQTHVTVTVPATNKATQSDYDLAVQTLAKSPSRILITLIQTKEFVLFAKAAAKTNLGRDWVLIGGDNALTFSASSDGSLTERERVYYNGILAVASIEANPGFPRFDTMAARWQQQFGDQVFSQTLYALHLAGCAEVLVHSWLDILQRPSVGGLASIRNKTYVPGLADYISVPRDTVSGRTVFEPSGDRNGTYLVYNVRANGSKAIVFRQQPDGQLRALDPIQLLDGSSTIPDGRAKYTVLFPARETPGVIVIQAISGLLMLAVLVSWCIILFYRKSRRVRHLGLPFITVFCVGLCISLATPIISAGMPTSATCTAQYWTLVLGFSLCLSSIWIRLYRIWMVYDNRILSKSHSIKTVALVRRMMVMPVVQVVLLGVMNAQGGHKPVRVVLSSGSLAQDLCVDGSGQGVADGLFYTAASLDAILLFLLGVISWKTRQVHTSFKDTVYIAIAIHNLILAAIISFALAALFESQSVTVYFVKAIGVIYANLILFLTMVFRHVIHLRQESVAAPTPASMVQTVNEGEEEGSSMVAGSGALSSSMAGGQGSTLGKSSFGGVYAIKPTTGLFRRWSRYEVTLSTSEGVLTLFPYSSTASGASTTTGGGGGGGGTSATGAPLLGSPHGQALRVRACILDVDPVDYPNCIAISLPSGSTNAFMIQFNSHTERGRWAAAMQALGAGQRAASMSTSGGGTSSDASGKLGKGGGGAGMATAVKKSGSIGPQEHGYLSAPAVTAAGAPRPRGLSLNVKS
ncbi:periplasmic binding protein-like I [Catenaria anguillulae PL171]|uniref:Periplasmic binding protein-like I n=1 Tax=Catenaria anguillulae PL171 TaxID=765915 RepID=A0A1Y2HSK6_9FUNG|nr:periplasmic binding protein-like I [Catenaria anguillulae PL171]